MVVRFPDNLDAWERYNQVRLDGIGSDDGGKAANAYYKAHRGVLDSGGKVQWEDDVLPRRLSALQSAMDLYLANRRAFASEHQQEPQDDVSRLYVLTPDMVSSRTTGTTRSEVPEGYQYVTAGVDVNDYALSWAVVSTRYDLNTTVIDYGRYPGEPAALWGPTAQYTLQTAITRGIQELVTVLAGRWPMLHRIAVDGNYETETVYSVCEKLDKVHKPDIITARGVGSKSYFVPNSPKSVVRAGDGVHILRQRARGRSLWFDSHRFHKLLQCGCLLPQAAAGAVSFFGQPGQQHSVIAAHICADTLESVVVRDDGREIMTWTRDETQVNDLADAVAMALAAAAVEGARPHDQNIEPKARTHRGLVRSGGGGARATTGGSARGGNWGWHRGR